MALRPVCERERDRCWSRRAGVVQDGL